jgi:hypothetical protein
MKIETDAFATPRRWTGNVRSRTPTSTASGRKWKRCCPASTDREHSPVATMTKPISIGERDYKWNAHRRWREALSEATFRRMIQKRQFQHIASLAIGIKSRTNLLFSFEKMALRDAVRSPAGAQAFATALFDLLHGDESLEVRFSSWVAAVSSLPANARADVAAGDRVRLHRPTRHALFLQANGDARGGPALRGGVALCLAPFLAALSRSACVR